MKIEELLQLHETTCAQARDVMRAKNHDYTGDADDPFANFRASQVIGVDPVLGILMRMMDKFKRVETYVKKDHLAVNDESVEDSLDDCINYIILAKGLIREQQLTREWLKGHQDKSAPGLRPPPAINQSKNAESDEF